MSKYCAARPELSLDSLRKLARAIESIREARSLGIAEFLKEIGWSTGTYYRALKGEGISQMSVWKARVWLRKQQDALARKVRA